MYNMLYKCIICYINEGCHLVLTPNRTILFCFRNYFRKPSGTFRNCGFLKTYLRQDLQSLLTDDLQTQICNLQGTHTGHTYGAQSEKSSTYGQALNTSITNHSMKKLPELLPVIFRNLPELRGN